VAVLQLSENELPAYGLLSIVISIQNSRNQLHNIRVKTILTSVAVLEIMRCIALVAVAVRVEVVVVRRAHKRTASRHVHDVCGLGGSITAEFFDATPNYGRQAGHVHVMDKQCPQLLVVRVQRRLL
jgi:hypothetical protein